MRVSRNNILNSGGLSLSKVKVRLVSPSKSDLERVRRHLLKQHPQMIMSKPKKGNNPKYSNWLSYGDYWIGKIRRRRNQE
jgi:hypothetical protein